MPANRVLIVESAAKQIADYRAVLSGVPFVREVLACSSGVAAVRMVTEVRIDAIIFSITNESDFNLLEMHHIRRTGSRALLIAVAVGETEPSRMLAQAAGADVFLLRHEMADYIEQILASCGSTTSIERATNSHPQVTAEATAVTTELAADHPALKKFGTMAPTDGCLTPDSANPSVTRWCSTLSQACSDLCHSTDLPDLPGGRQSCAVICKRAMEEQREVRGTCPGGLTVVAAPSPLDNSKRQIVTRIESDPPRQLSELVTVSELYGLDLSTIQAIARSGDAPNSAPRPVVLEKPARELSECRSAGDNGSFGTAADAIGIDHLMEDMVWLLHASYGSVQELAESVLHQLLLRSHCAGAGLFVIPAAARISEVSLLLLRDPHDEITSHASLLDANLISKLLQSAAPVFVTSNHRDHGSEGVRFCVSETRNAANGVLFPLCSGNRVNGALAILIDTAVTKEWLSQITSTAEVISMAVDRALMTQRLEFFEAQRTSSGSVADRVAARSDALIEKSDWKLCVQHSRNIASDLENAMNILTRETSATPENECVVASNSRAVSDCMAIIRQCQQDLMAFGRLGTPLQSVDCDLTSVFALPDAWLRHFRPANVRVIRTLQPQLPPLQCDRTLLQRSLLSVIRHACEAMSEGGELRISAIEHGPFVSFGKEVSNSVVIEISQFSDSLTETSNSDTLGPRAISKASRRDDESSLAAVMTLMLRAGGRLEQRGDSKDGMNLRLILPCPATREDSHLNSSLQSSAPLVATVLLVDDDDAVCKMLELVLQRSGYRVLSASDPAAARRLAARDDESIDILLCDATLTPVAGPALFEELRRVRPSLRVLLISGFTEQNLAEHNIELNGLPLLQKPFTSAELVSRLRVLPAAAVGEQHPVAY